MDLDYKIPQWISTQIYNENTSISDNLIRSYIRNEKKHTKYLLEGCAAYLWYMIVNKESEDNIKQFLSQNNLENEFEDFINNLIEEELISDNLNKTEKSCDNICYDEITFDENLLKKEQVFEENLRQYAETHHYLTSLFFELTNKCNEKCIHCYSVAGKNEITFDEIKSVIDDAAELGVIKITVSGGECTLNKDFLEIIKYIRKKHLSLHIYTNGQNLYDNPKLLEEILKLYPSRISLSLYSMNAKIHDKITGIKGSQEKTLKVIKELKKRNVDVEIKSFQTKYNCDTVDEILDFAKENGITASIDSILFYNKDKDNSWVQATENQLLKLYSNNKIPENTSLKLNIDNDFLNSGFCNAGVTTLSVNSKLEVLPCIGLYLPLGNIKTKSLKEIWNDKNQNSPLNKYKSLKRKDLKECYKHEYCKYCSYCFGKALSESGFLKKSNICCTHAKIKMKVHGNKTKKVTLH